jgi:hypothetical protein
MRFPFYILAEHLTLHTNTYMGKADTVRGVDVEGLSLGMGRTTSSGISDCASAGRLWRRS